MITVLIVEDEIEAYKFLSECIKEIIPDSRIINAVSGELALEVLAEKDVDILFVDRGLPGGFDGVTLVREIRKKIEFLTLPVVFISAMDTGIDEIMRKYKNFEYITKPYTREEFINKLKDFLLSVRNRKRNYIVENLDEEVRTIYSDGKYETIKINEILFAEIYYHYVTLYTVSNTYEKIKTSIDKFVDLINYPLFIQCQKSYAVNIRKVKGIGVVNKELIIDFEGSDDKCKVGLIYKDRVMELIKANNQSNH